MRLVDADALSDVILKEDFSVEDALISVDRALTVDAVEVVRCGQCKHYELTWKSDDGDTFGNCKASDMVDVKTDFFCACGERKGGS